MFCSSIIHFLVLGGVGRGVFSENYSFNAVMTLDVSSLCFVFSSGVIPEH